MSPEDPFRIALLMIFSITIAVTAYHRVQAAKSGERISRREEGLLRAVSLRLAGLSLWVATLTYLVDPGWMEWAQVTLPSPQRWSGAVVGFLGCALMVWTLVNLGRNLTDTVVTRVDATLVTTGPYRWVRHPFYFAVALLMIAVTLLTANGLIGLCALLVLAMLVVRTRKEEQKLIEKFGDDYRAYMAATGRLWPKI